MSCLVQSQQQQVKHHVAQLPHDIASSVLLYCVPLQKTLWFRRTRQAVQPVVAKQ